MKTTKSKAAYTNKWLSRNRHLWHETIINGIKIIILDKMDAPNIVVERIKEINRKRGYGATINPCIRNMTNSASLSIYTEEELKELEKEDSSTDDDIEYDEYDEYYDDDD